MFYALSLNAWLTIAVIILLPTVFTGKDLFHVNPPPLVKPLGLSGFRVV